MISRLVRAWLLTGIVDGLYACVLGELYYGSPARVFRGVAATLLGPSAITGGTRTLVIGVLMHFSVALWWSSVFLFLVLKSESLRVKVSTWLGAVEVAAIYGPCIWMAMSLIVIPLLVRRPPTINFRWWSQLIGHIPFVGVPLVSSIGVGSVALPAPLGAELDHPS